MRDPRFIAVHRGGWLDRASHHILARWAADCAELVLHHFTRQSDDRRPKDALEAARRWAEGEIKAGLAMKASVAAHAAARQCADKAAIAAARACGHAVATAHAGDHCLGALLYALKALEASGAEAEPELEHQLAKLPPHLLPAVSAGIHARMRSLGIRGGSIPSHSYGNQLPNGSSDFRNAARSCLDGLPTTQLP